MNDGLTLPLEVRSPEGDFLGSLLMNRKAFQKSIERRELWTVLAGNGRVLPLAGTSFRALEAVEGHRYRAVLEPGEAVAAFRAALRGTFSTLTEADLPAPEASVSSGEPTLAKLKQVIAGRRRELPEGSYTTHLFQKGEDKIRKKTGEEAIELILATERKDLVSEAADLIYHLMVLLEVKEIPVEDVLAELESRMKG